MHSIDEVIDTLEQIIIDSKTNQNPLGYFAALYLKVTKKVKEGIDQGLFEDNPRMEKLDIIFAQRYLDAYFDYQKNQPVTTSWAHTFELSTRFWPIVLQHLLLGMNAHINLDLGIAAAEVSKGKNIDDLNNDFHKINEILSSLVEEVENNLALVWPTLKWMLKLTLKADNFLADFSMKKARDGAWKFARSMTSLSDEDFPVAIAERDKKVAKKTALILHPGWITSFVLWIIRLSEQGSVSEKIEKLSRTDF